MSYTSLSAHFDGEKICLDEQIKLKPNAKLIVTVLSEYETLDERNDWNSLSLKSLGNAYGMNEPEYSLKMIKEPNPEYGK